MSGEIDRLEAYRQAGVDLDLSNAASQIAADWAQTTWQNRAGEFGEPVSYDSSFAANKRLVFDEIRRRPGVDGVCGIDGTGTKPEFYELMKSFKGLGHDLVAMAADDNPIDGGQTVLINNALIVSSLGKPGADYLGYIDQLFEGLAEAANNAGIVLFTGETAVHGNRLQGPTDFTVDWVGDAIGLVHEKRAITGEKIKVGDELWGLAEPDSARCNGISAIRKALNEYYGENWYTELLDGKPLGEYAITPSTVYSGLLKQLTGGYKLEVPQLIDIHGAAHISGGSMWEKVGRMLRATGFGALIDDPFEFPAFLRHIQEIARVKVSDDEYRPMSDEEALTTWHCGQGYILAINGQDGPMLQETAAQHGMTAKRIGRVVPEPGITIMSKGLWTPGKLLTN